MVCQGLHGFVRFLIVSYQDERETSLCAFIKNNANFAILVLRKLSSNIT